jgi:ADP-heptose:LPS heptosyltransferase
MSFPPAPERVRRILLCQQRQIGDVLLATPAIQLVHEHYPEAEIHFFTEKKCAPILEGNPHLHKLWVVDRKQLNSLPKELAWYWKVARQNYDLVVDFQQLPRCRWVVGFSGAPVRLTFTPPWYHRPLYNHWSTPRGGYGAMTKASILEPLGIRWNGEKPRIYLAPEEHEAMRTLLAQMGLRPEHKLITMDPTSQKATRRWPAAHYARLLTLAAERDPALRFLPLWGPGEEAEVRAIVAAAGRTDHILLTPHMLSLREMAACVAEARLHMGNDSAPRHVAVAVDTPSFTIRGSTGLAWVFPSPEHTEIALDLPCQPCTRATCHTRCLTDLTPEAVTDGMLAHLARYGG